MELHSHGVESRCKHSHPCGGRRLSPVAAPIDTPLSRSQRRRRRGHARWQMAAEVATMLFGLAAFYAMTWMLAAVVR